MNWFQIYVIAIIVISFVMNCVLDIASGRPIQWFVNLAIAVVFVGGMALLIEAWTRRSRRR
jgi:peptidoglycan/LPS O-acetylase OafA/YrhL